MNSKSYHGWIVAVMLTVVGHVLPSDFAVAYDMSLSHPASNRFFRNLQPSRQTTHRPQDAAYLQTVLEDLLRSHNQAGASLDLGLTRGDSATRVVRQRGAIREASSAFGPGRKRRSAVPTVNFKQL